MADRKLWTPRKAIGFKRGTRDERYMINQIFRAVTPIAEQHAKVMAEWLKATRRWTSYKLREPHVWGEVEQRFMAMYKNAGRLGSPGGLTGIAAQAARHGAYTSRRHVLRAAERYWTYRMIQTLRVTGYNFGRVLANACILANMTSIAVFFDQVKVQMEQLCRELDDEHKTLELIAEAAYGITEILSGYVEQFKHLLRVLPIALPGGGPASGIPAPLTATGRLANAIGILDTRPVKKVYRGKPSLLSAVIGIMPGGGDDSMGRVPSSYGYLLARTVSTRPPQTDIQYFGRAARERLVAWASARGIPTTGPQGGWFGPHLRRIERKIFHRGVYGREWVVQIVKRIDLTPYIDALGKKIMERFHQLLES